jgi:hypothetical protein
MFDNKIKEFVAIGGFPLLSRYDNSMSRLLSQIYPDYNWISHSEKSMSPNVKKSQHLLKSTLKALFPKEGIFPLFQ